MIVWHVYLGDNNGGPINYQVIVATVSDPTYTTASMPVGSMTLIGVRAFDTETGLEDQNTDVFIPLIVNSNGSNGSDRPGSPLALSVEPVGQDGAAVRWRYLRTPGMPDPDHFHIFEDTGEQVDWNADPDIVIPFNASNADYRVEIVALTTETVHAFGVQAVRGTSRDGNHAVALMTPKGSPPLNVSGLNVKLVSFERI